MYEWYSLFCNKLQDSVALNNTLTWLARVYFKAPDQPESERSVAWNFLAANSFIFTMTKNQGSFSIPSSWYLTFINLHFDQTWVPYHTFSLATILFLRYNPYKLIFSLHSFFGFILRCQLEVRKQCTDKRSFSKKVSSHPIRKTLISRRYKL